MIEIVLLLAFCCFIFIVVLAGWFLNRGGEGDECQGKDENGTYIIEKVGEKLECTLNKCATGYYKSGKECLVDQSGTACVPIGIPDPQGTYLTDKIGECKLSSCETGFAVDGTTCTEEVVTFTIPVDGDSTAECYLSRYSDLRVGYGTDKAAATNHYTTNTTNGSEARDNSCTLSDAEAQCYLDRYPAVQAYAGTNLKLARKHYYEVGMGVNNDFVCPPGKKEFQCYLDRYPDLQVGTYNNVSAARTHWINHGEREGRDYSCP